MTEKQRDDHKFEERIFKLFELFTESIAWLQIVASPLLIGLIIGATIYFSKPSPARHVIGIIVTITGLIIGIIWATKQWKEKGTVWFISRIMATPELDNPPKENNEAENNEKQE